MVRMDGSEILEGMAQGVMRTFGHSVDKAAGLPNAVMGRFTESTPAIGEPAFDNGIECMNMRTSLLRLLDGGLESGVHSLSPNQLRKQHE